MRTVPLFVEETNLSVAWALPFLQVMERGVRGLAPLVVHLTGFENDEPQELPAVRTCLDDTLRKFRQYSTQTNANLICPIAWWERALNRHAFFTRFREFYPGLRRWNRLNSSTVFPALTEHKPLPYNSFQHAKSAERSYSDGATFSGPPGRTA